MVPTVVLFVRVTSVQPAGGVSVGWAEALLDPTSIDATSTSPAAAAAGAFRRMLAGESDAYVTDVDPWNEIGSDAEPGAAEMTRAAATRPPSETHRCHGRIFARKRGPVANSPLTSPTSDCMQGKR